MIYLIDDNIGNKRIEEMKISFCDDGSFDNLLISIERLEKGCDLSFLKEAACILIHKTTLDCDENSEFIQNSSTNVSTIIENISDYGKYVPLVIFSNQMSERSEFDYHSNPNCIYQIKKTIFYGRLYNFLEHYQNTNSLELRILARGNNYKATEISHYANKLLQHVAFLPSNQLLNLSSISLSVFRSFYDLSEITIPFTDLVAHLEDYPISNRKFKKNISLIVNSITSYGKNIHNWKE